jgi:hypothetical protein
MYQSSPSLKHVEEARVGLGERESWVIIQQLGTDILTCLLHTTALQLERSALAVFLLQEISQQRVRRGIRPVPDSKLTTRGSEFVRSPTAPGRTIVTPTIFFEETKT